MINITKEISDKEKIVLSFFDNDIVELFDIPNLTDIFWNADGSIFTKIQGRESFFKNHNGSLRILINEIAHLNELVVNESNPILETSFLGMRITAVIPPMGTAPTLTIRKPNYQIIPLEKYVEDGILTQSQHKSIISNFVISPKNILICGGTGSGKTTLANAILNALALSENTNGRIVSIQDNPELVLQMGNVLELFSTRNFSIQDCLKVTLRQSPKRILVGEVRDHAVVSMLDAWNTGHHGGLATIHANSAMDGIQRIISLGNKHYDLAELYNLIAITVGIVISIQELPNGKRKVNEIIAIKGYDSQTKTLITEKL